MSQHNGLSPRHSADNKFKWLNPKLEAQLAALGESKEMLKLLDLEFEAQLAALNEQEEVDFKPFYAPHLPPEEKEAVNGFGEHLARATLTRKRKHVFA